MQKEPSVKDWDRKKRDNVKEIRKVAREKDAQHSYLNSFTP